MMTVRTTSHFPDTSNTTTKQMRIPLPAKAVLAFFGHICERGHKLPNDVAVKVCNELRQHFVVNGVAPISSNDLDQKINELGESVATSFGLF
ncbi:Hypothetical protein PHPALM_38070 [Phytophthora palmivora]|uniref:Uncharacterized protein n=1 Tax=Phytophthora palmivora TaxID=4796 RepID=A0A2P4WVU3_9STRA|nr:Hypothetical protein PHPALM_38070 [Phytophthora palmivora]